LERKGAAKETFSMSGPARRWISPEEYLAIEEHAEYRSEYFNGEISAMAGSSPEHNLIAVNISRELADQLDDRPCRVYAIDLRVTVTETGLFTYPDIVVACGASEFDEQRPQSLLNPTLIVEVLSPSTEAYDRGAKFAHYRLIPSLQEYVLVSTTAQRIELFTRQPNSAEWLKSTCDSREGSLRLTSIGCSVHLEKAYHKVELTPEDPRS